MKLAVLLPVLSVFGCGGDGGPGEDAGDDSAGVCEEPTPHFCLSACRECCEDSHCDDSNDCTSDSCVALVCNHEPFHDRSVLCNDGICCEGVCRPDGECCENADCTDGCKGTARTCASLESVDCEGQADCWWSEAGSCSGDQDCTVMDSNQAGCEECECYWSDYWDVCGINSGPGCEVYPTSYRCERCGCEWFLAGCHGSLRDCREFYEETSCNRQLDCHWSVCTDYHCT